MTRRTLARWTAPSQGLFPSQIEVVQVGDQVQVTLRDAALADGRCGYTHGLQLSAHEFGKFLAALTVGWEEISI